MRHVKVLFRLEKDDDGYPPADVEGIWAEEMDSGVFVIDNIPFYSHEVSLGDVIEVETVADEYFYSGTRQKSGNSLVRVIVFDGRDSSDLRCELKKLGCATEQSDLKSLVAVNIPPTVDMNKVRAILDEGCGNGWWDYEEAIIRQ